VGFEPTVRENRTPDFESGTFDHSATSPGVHALKSVRVDSLFSHPHFVGTEGKNAGFQFVMNEARYFTRKNKKRSTAKVPSFDAIPAQ
jgi:hypothetical protein